MIRFTLIAAFLCIVPFAVYASCESELTEEEYQWELYRSLREMCSPQNRALVCTPAWQECTEFQSKVLREYKEKHQTYPDAQYVRTQVRSGLNKLCAIFPGTKEKTIDPRWSGEQSLKSEFGNQKCRTKIGEGSRGKVHKIECDGDTLVKKTAKDEGLESLERETRIFQKLQSHERSPSFPKAEAFGIDEKGNKALITEFVQGETLTKKLSGFLLPQAKRLIIDGILSAVRVLQSNNLVHLDLHSDNVMVTKDWSVKVIDLGEAWDPESEKAPYNEDRDGLRGGDVGTRPPEMMSFEVDDDIGKLDPQKSDSWAAGWLILKVIASGTPKLADVDLVSLTAATDSEAKDAFIESVFATCNEPDCAKIMGLTKGLLEIDSHKRITACMALRQLR